MHMIASMLVYIRVRMGLQVATTHVIASTATIHMYVNTHTLLNVSRSGMFGKRKKTVAHFYVLHFLFLSFS